MRRYAFLVGFLLVLAAPFVVRGAFLSGGSAEDAAAMSGPELRILTPHNQDIRQTFARAFGGVMLLKGAGTVVTDGTGVYRNATGNPGMGTGGTGDVLAGVIAALIAQGLEAFDAAVLGAWVHGRAGDLGAAALGRTALTAPDLLDYLPAAFKELETHW